MSTLVPLKNVQKSSETQQVGFPTHDHVATHAHAHILDEKFASELARLNLSKQLADLKERTSALEASKMVAESQLASSRILSGRISKNPSTDIALQTKEVESHQQRLSTLYVNCLMNIANAELREIESSGLDTQMQRLNNLCKFLDEKMQAAWLSAMQQNALKCYLKGMQEAIAMHEFIFNAQRSQPIGLRTETMQVLGQDIAGELSHPVFTLLRLYPNPK